MGRHKFNRPNKRDTPVKRALSRRDKLSECRRLLPNKHYEAFPEEPEVKEMNVPTVKPAHPVLTSIKPAHCKYVLRLRSPAFTENPRDKVVSPAAPAGHQTIQTTPEPEAFKGGEMPVKEEKQNLTVTLGSISSSSMESDTTFSSDDDDDGDEEDSSASATSSNLPSPEIFRRESYVETLTFPFTEELLGLHLHIKNSTLLDVSHAESINMFHPPNVSNILDVSTIFAEKSCEINKNRGPEAETKIHTDSFKTEKAFKGKTPPKLTNSRPISYKKKVWFCPIIAETFEAKHTPASKLTIHMSSPAEQLQPDADTSRAGEINSKEEALRLTATLKRPVQSSPEKAKFFDFIDNSDRDAFFKGMRERCVHLRSAPLFPLTAPEYTEPFVL
ncbi:uncharacterized protein LOC119475163 [Sebastes umbrosus]|uniref:uncharacterized protein LOC119475163 n=1 Tax=Sebastes umbrosus TaxID=72105 RepID=UPI00189FD47A|nr:uncharacterized protein LOC119475163 [Sebastes umbrosus]